MKKVIVLGSTGSVGKKAVEVITRYPDLFQLVGISCKTNTDLITQQAAFMNVEAVAVTDATHKDVSDALGISGIKVFVGKESMLQLMDHLCADVLLCAVAGIESVVPLLYAVQRYKHVAVASKESLVMAGRIIADIMRKQDTAELIPVDSEHNAIFQCVRSRPGEEIVDITLTASGGPFFGSKNFDPQSVTVPEALAHPRWRMGKKISIDSATMMNKVFEVIEARWLFDIPYNKIRVLVHPEAVVHGFVRYHDGSIIAQMSHNDMALPITYALSYPDLVQQPPCEHLDLERVGSLQFFTPDENRFPCLRFLHELGDMTDGACAAMCVADEELVAAFLENRICFGHIYEGIKHAIETCQIHNIRSIDDVMKVTEETRHEVQKWIRQSFQ